MANSNKICIYKSKSIDGFASAFSVWLNDETVEFFPICYGDTLPTNINNRDIIILGFNIGDNIKNIISVSNSVLIISNNKEYYGLEETEKIKKNINEEDCISISTWKYFHNTDPPTFIQYIDDYENSKFKLPFTKEVYASISVYDMTFNNYMDLYRTYIDDLVIEGSAILRKFNKDLNNIINNMFFLRLDDIRIPFIYIPYFYNTNCIDILVKKYSVGCVFYNIGNKFYFLLKSDKNSNINVLKIAKTYGGEGTFNLAGFVKKFDKDPTIQAFLLNDYKKKFPTRIEI